MDASSREQEWSGRWKEGRTGFHQSEVNGFLIKHWARLVPNPTATVLVPLCGKSHDMCWLRDRGHRVVGVEFVEMACRAFFEEKGWPYQRMQRVNHIRFVGEGPAEGMTILCGDLFALTASDIGPVDAWYDRAAIVALPPALRSAYADWMNKMLPSGSIGLMMTFDYPQEERDGPPFSVRYADVEVHFEDTFHLTLLERVDMTEGNRWELSRVHKPVVHLIRR